MGLTDKGYIRRTYDDILKDKIERAKELFGEDIDTSDLSVLGKFLRINAYDQAMAEEEIEAVYYARFPNTASGQSLDRLAAFVGISRNPATPAVYSVRVHGDAEYTIPAGFTVGTEMGHTYQTEQAYTIGEDGTCLIEASCTVAGTTGNLSSAHDICRIMNPDANVTSVDGVERTVDGTDEESDTDLRLRFTSASAGSGSGNENAIRAAVLRVPTVQYVAVIANDTNATDSSGRPPHSFECYVLGGDEYEQEIAEAIFSKRPVGITTVGEKSVTILDITETERTVKYSPVMKVNVIVKVKVKTSTSFPTDGVTQIKSNVSSYINDLRIGNSLVLSSIYGHIYSIPGVKEVTALELSKDGGSTFGTDNITVPAYGVVLCEGVLVEVAE